MGHQHGTSPQEARSKTTTRRKSSRRLRQLLQLVPFEGLEDRQDQVLGERGLPPAVAETPGQVEPAVRGRWTPRRRPRAGDRRRDRTGRAASPGSTLPAPRGAAHPRAGTALLPAAGPIQQDQALGVERVRGHRAGVRLFGGAEGMLQWRERVLGRRSRQHADRPTCAASTAMSWSAGCPARSAYARSSTVSASSERPERNSASPIRQRTRAASWSCPAASRSSSAWPRSCSACEMCSAAMASTPACSSSSGDGRAPTGRPSQHQPERLLRRAQRPPVSTREQHLPGPSAQLVGVRIVRGELEGVEQVRRDHIRELAALVHRCEVIGDRKAKRLAVAVRDLLVGDRAQRRLHEGVLAALCGEGVGEHLHDVLAAKRPEQLADVVGRQRP